MPAAMTKVSNESICVPKGAVRWVGVVMRKWSAFAVTIVMVVAAGLILGAPAAAAAAPPAGIGNTAKGWDTSAAVSASAVQCMKSNGFSFDILYTNFPNDWQTTYSALGADGMQAVLLQGWVNPPFWADPATGTTTGQTDVAAARQVGYPQGADYLLDVEGMSGSRATVVAWINNWAAQIAAGGFIPGVYSGSGTPLSGADLTSAVLPQVKVYWQSGSTSAPDPAQGYVAVQTLQVNGPCGFAIDPDTAYVDNSGNSLIGSGTGQNAAAKAAQLAVDNVGKSAGSCSQLAAATRTNSLSGSNFDSTTSNSCSGGGEFWCADFLAWVWRNAGIDVAGLTAGAVSFRDYGDRHNTHHTSAQVGDAITYSKTQGSRSTDHVGIVVGVNADGSLVTVNGDWNGTQNQGQTIFAQTASAVQFTIPAGQTSIGSQVPNASHYYITDIVGPSGSGGGGTPPGNPYTPVGVCGAGYAVVDSHTVTGATIYLTYNNSTGNNCVVTMAAADGGAVSMNATLAVQGGSSGSDPGSYHWYAGPVVQHAPSSCVQWGGAYKTSSWTSGWSHCGTPPATNPYTPVGVCGAGYAVVDSHTLTGATIYLLYSGGRNCVVTMATTSTGAKVAMNASLAVQGGSSAHDLGSYQWYAGPITLSAAAKCVQWGGSYQSSSWTSGWSHCG